MTMLSIVMPSYNEEFRLRSALDEIAELIAERPGEAEVLVGDDGSQDDTATVDSRVTALSYLATLADVIGTRRPDPERLRRQA